MRRRALCNHRIVSRHGRSVATEKARTQRPRGVAAQAQQRNQAEHEQKEGEPVRQRPLFEVRMDVLSVERLGRSGNGRRFQQRRAEQRKATAQTAPKQTHAATGGAPDPGLIATATSDGPTAGCGNLLSDDATGDWSSTDIGSDPFFSFRCSAGSPPVDVHGRAVVSLMILCFFSFLIFL